MKQKKSKAFRPQEPVFNDDRSTLSDFLWNESPHETQSRQMPASAGENATASSRRHTKALKDESLQPEEFYTQSQPMFGQNDLGQSDAAVESRQISKEEFPQG